MAGFNAIFSIIRQWFTLSDHPVGCSCHSLWTPTCSQSGRQHNRVALVLRHSCRLRLQPYSNAERNVWLSKKRERRLHYSWNEIIWQKKLHPLSISLFLIPATQACFPTHSMPTCRWSIHDDVDVTVITRRHVGGILYVTNDCIRMRILEILIARLLCFDFSTNMCKFKTLHCCNKHTPNMAAFTIVDRMASLSSHVWWKLTALLGLRWSSIYEVYVRCSGAIELSIKSRRHIGVIGGIRCWTVVKLIWFNSFFEIWVVLVR